MNEYENKIVLFESEKQETVLIRVLKLSECAFGYAGLADLQIDGELVKPTQREDDALKIEFIGDIPKLTIVQFKIKKRCPISALLWASCGDQDTRYINPVFQAWILHEAPQARECQLSWESPW